MAQKNIIEVNHRYVQGVFAKSYRLTENYRESDFRLVEVNTPLIARKVVRDQRAQKNEAEKHPAGRINWANLCRLKLDIAIISNRLNAPKERLFLAQYQLDRHRFYSIDDQGRHHHFVAAMPRSLRRYLYLPGENLVILDYRHCQPALHVTLYREDCAERQRYVALCQEGNLWIFLNQLLKNPYDLTDPQQKKNFKEMCFGQIFYGAVRTTPGFLQAAFAREFPVLWSRICEEKTPDLAALPRKMQTLESSIVIRGVLSPDYFCVSIHDAILTTETDAPRVRNAMEAAYLKRVGFVPSIDETQLGHACLRRGISPVLSAQTNTTGCQ